MNHINKKLIVFIRSFFHRRVKGILNPIIYQSRVPSGNWQPLFGDFEQERQKFGNWDTDSCWLVSVLKQFVAQLNWLKQNNLLSPQALQFYTVNGYFDATGSASPSQRYLENLSGNRYNGGTAEEAIQLIQSYGFIPKMMLAYTDAQAAQFSDELDFDTDYFNPAAVTPAMVALGKQAVSYLKVQYQRIGSQWTTPDRTEMATFIQLAPFAYGVPVNAVEWNQVNVPADTDVRMDHEVSGYQAIQTGQGWPIIDNYVPYEKTLAEGYLLASVMQMVVTALPEAVSAPQSLTAQVWAAVAMWFASAGLAPFLGKVASRA